MDGSSPDGLAERKKLLREQAHAARNAQADKDDLSRTILERFHALDAYRSAKTVMYYIDVRSEVRTRFALPEAMTAGKRVVVPWCNDAGELELFHLTSMDELAVGMYKILEPKVELRGDPKQNLRPEDLDLVMVPGVAFDRRGGRMGHGKGYYDKLLQHARPDAPLAALAFDCQLFDEIPMASHDIFMDFVLTESNTFKGVGRGAN